MNTMIFVCLSVLGHGVEYGRRLVERLARVQDAAGLAVDGELVGALDQVAKRVMARMPVGRAAALRPSIFPAQRSTQIPLSSLLFKVGPFAAAWYLAKNR